LVLQCINGILYIYIFITSMISTFLHYLITIQNWAWASKKMYSVDQLVTEILNISSAKSIRLFRIMSIPTTFCLFRVFTSEPNDLPIYISDIRHILGYRTSVFIQPFPWCLHITITYNLPHLRLWYADVTVIA
jgi:hypothetical protein